MRNRSLRKITGGFGLGALGRLGVGVMRRNHATPRNLVRIWRGAERTPV